MTGAFDDYLGLLDRPVGDVRLIVFAGMSGSGKSTYIDGLLAAHSELADETVTQLGPAPVAWPAALPDSKWVVIDELLFARELVEVRRLLRAGHSVIAASHLSVPLTRWATLPWKAWLIRTDASIEKLEMELTRRGARHSRTAVESFANSLGANYTDLEIVLERGPNTDFDLAWRRFQRHATIEHTPSIPRYGT